MKKTTQPPKPERIDATLEIDGEVYSLVYDFNAIADAEPATGVNLMHATGAAALNPVAMTGAQVRGLLYAVLHPKHRLSLEGAGALIRMDTLGRIKAALKTCARATMSPKDVEVLAAAEAELLKE